MAGELTVTSSVSFLKDGAEFKSRGSARLDVAGQNGIKFVKQMTDVDYTFDKGAIGTIGRVFVANLDADNEVWIGANGSDYPLKIKPLSHISTDWNAADIHGVCDTGLTAYIEATLTED